MFQNFLIQLLASSPVKGKRNMIKASASPPTLDHSSDVRVLCFFYLVISIDNFIQVSSYTFRYVRADDQTYRSPQTGNESDARLQTATSSERCTP
jgi:hypothetical protein